MTISDHNRKALWGRSGGACARCKDRLVEDGSLRDREALVGEEAHIVSKAKSGPRHGPEPAGGYDGLDNLILLCRVCHAIVDAQPATYPVETLCTLRDGHVEWVKSRTRSSQPLPQVRFSPIPANLDLELVASGRQLVDLISGTEDISFRHDQPRDSADATLMSELLKRVEEADMEIDAIGAHHAVELSHVFHEMLLEHLLPHGIIVLGARAQRTISSDERSLPWTTCVLRLQYAPRTSQPHGSKKPGQRGAGTEDLRSLLQSLLAEGRRMAETARISADGSSAVIEVWERDLRRALENNMRHDLAERFDSAGRPDPATLVSGAWATKRRLARRLAVVAEILGELPGTHTD